LHLVFVFNLGQEIFVMLRIGLTGGIGSGKTTVARIFEVLGVPVYYADDAAKQLMNEDAAVMEAVIKQFGEGAYTNGVLNRTYLANIVFNDPEKLKLLNSIAHPATISHAKNWMTKQDVPYIIKEAALLFESGSSLDLDYVIGVSAPEHLRIARAMRRDNISEADVRKRMDRQMNELDKIKRCDFVLMNDEASSLIEQVVELDKKLRNL
jgi:dephospho-CoA kinase